MNKPLLAAVALLAGLALVYFWLDPRGPRAGSNAAAPATPGALAEPGPAADRGRDLQAPGSGTVDPAVPLGSVGAAPGRDVAKLQPSAELPPSQQPVIGRVLDVQGRPVPGAEVNVGLPLPEHGFWFGDAPDADELTATTDEDGSFSLPAPGGDGLCRVSVRAEGFVDFQRDQTPTPTAGGLDLGVIELQVAALLAGRVLCPNGAPVAGVTLHLNETPSASQLFLRTSSDRGELLATTTADGSFSIRKLPSGPWNVLAVHPEHPDQEFFGTLPAGGSSGQVWKLQPGEAISGRVLGDDPSELEGLRVRATPSEGMTFDGTDGTRDWREAACAADGSFRIAGLGTAHKRYQLQALVGRGALFDTEWRSPEIEAELGDQGVQLRLTPSVTLGFSLVDAGTGEALDEWELELVHRGELHRTESLSHDDLDRVTRLQETGAFRVNGVRPPANDSRTSLQLTAPGYFPVTAGPASLFGQREFDFGRLAAAPQPKIKVLVTEAASGEPIEGAEVELHVLGEPTDYTVDPDGQLLFGQTHYFSAETDSDGFAQLPRIDGQSLRLGAHADDFAPAEDLELVLSSAQGGGAPDYRFELIRGGRVDVLVLDPAGHPVPQCKVTAKAYDQEREDTTDELGQVSFERLRPGAYTFEAKGLNLGGGFSFGDDEEPIELGPHAAQIAVVDGGQHPLTLQRPPAGPLVGRITEGGLSLAGAVVRAVPQGDFFIPGLTQHPEARTDEEGGFELEPLDAGDYDVNVEHPTRAMAHSLVLSIDEGLNRLDLDLPITELSGHVRGVDGAPLADVRVTVVDLTKTQSTRISFMVGSGDGSTLSFHSDDDFHARTDVEGRYALRGVPAERPLQLDLSLEDHQQLHSEPLTIAANEMRSGVDFTLAAAGQLLVSVPGAGNGAASVQATRVDPERESSEPPDSAADADASAGDEPVTVSGSTDDRGQVLFTGLAPGRWHVLVTAEDSGRVSQETPVEVAPGQVANATVSLP